VYRQDIPEEEYEVICVNDASPDHSRDIVLEYQKQHKNLVLIEHEHNKKLGAARNTGRSIARGKYIWNVDSDDYIAENCLSSILKQCEQHDLDILMFNLASDTEGVLKIADFQFCVSDTLQNGIACLNQNISEIGRFCPVWRYIYKRDFLDMNHIYSPEINMGEDVPYAFKSMILAKRVMLVNEVYYYYRINPASLTGVKLLPPKVLYEKCFLAARLVYDLMGLVPEEHVELKNVLGNMVRYIVQIFPDYLHKMSQADKKQFAAICRKCFFKDFALFRMINKTSKIEYLKCLLRI
jgi:glycosyltransferase involved in cell wall biosynthesis